jgi:hypothetical protein
VDLLLILIMNVLNNCCMLLMIMCGVEETVDFATLDTEELFSKLKSHKLSRKVHSNHDASHTSAHVGGHDVNPTNIFSSSMEFALSPLAAASDE